MILGVILKHNWCFKTTASIYNHSQHAKKIVLKFSFIKESIGFNIKNECINLGKSKDVILERVNNKNKLINWWSYLLKEEEHIKVLRNVFIKYLKCLH